MSNESILEKVNQAALKFLQPLGLEETYKTIAKEAKKLVEAEYGSIFIVKKNNSLERIYATSREVYKIKIRPEGFVYKSFRSRQPIVLGEKDIPTLPKEIQTLQTKTVVLIPLTYKGKSIGVLSVFSKKKRAFNNDELNLLKLFGSMATMAVKKVQLNEEAKMALEARNKYKAAENTLEKIHKASLKFLIPLTPEETYKTIVEEALKLVNGEDGTIFLEKEGKLQNVFGFSHQASKLVPRKRGFTFTSFSKRKAFVLRVDEWGKFHPGVQKKGVKSAIFIPLFYRRKSKGVLIVQSFRNKMFAERELEVLKLFGSLASLGIRKTQLYIEAKNALELRDLFISIAAHELRTPITSIYGYAQLLHKKKGDGVIPQAHWVDQLYGESTRLSRLVNELLEISRIQTGRLHFSWQECFLPEIIERAINTIHFNHPQHQFMFKNETYGKSNVIIGDYDKLVQVVINLLDNAAKFSPIDKPIIVMIKSTGSSLRVIVHDKGKGINSEDLPKVFQGFYKGKENFEIGMGLGLYLAKNIIEQHHGTINIVSELNKGTIAEVTIPKAKL